MIFNSLQFLIFLPVVLLINYILPKKIRYIWLLLASYFFYMCWNAKYALLLLGSTLVTYLSGLLMAKASEKYEEAKAIKRKKLIVAGSFIINLAILAFFKYANFFLSSLAMAARVAHIELNLPYIDVLLPVGISFYIFQALSYTMDVYRGDIYAEKNFARYALFVSFFPQLVAGPIERSKNLIVQLATPKDFNYENAREGLLLMLWGFFLKIVLADRIAIFVDTVYADFVTYNGVYLLVASVLFAIQIYCDFAGYSTIAIGTAKMLGVEIMQNFDTPYLALSVAEFWRRWHISLTSWFRDYLYIPLGGSRKGKIRKYINIMIVFLVSGLWHGANWSYVVWGGLNGIYQIIGELLKPVREKVTALLDLNPKTICYRVFQMIITFVLVDVSWVFFRASGVKEGFAILQSIARDHNIWILFDGSLYKCGLDIKNYNLMLLSIALLLIVDIFNHRGIKIRNIIIRQDWIARSFIIAIAICAILLFGIWGSSYDAANFIYFQF